MRPPTDEIERLRSELHELRQQQDALAARLHAITGAAEAVDEMVDAPLVDDGAGSRARPIGRRLVLTGAAAAAGAIAGALRGASPAAANGIVPLENGRLNVVTNQTLLVNEAGMAGPAPTDAESLANTDALLVLDNLASTRSSGSALHALGRSQAITASTSDGGTVIDARAGTVGGVGVSAIAAADGGIGVIASGAAFGIRAGGGAVAGDFVGNEYGVTLSGPRPLAFVSGHGHAGPPVTTGARGEVAFDAEGNLYLCVGPGTPGTWRRLAGPASAGALHLLPEPRRVYDSRANEAPLGPSNGGPKGAMADGEVRTIDAKANGAPVPPDATGLLFNLAVTMTNAAGFITAWGTGSRPLASSMNWSLPDTTLSNSVTIGAGPDATFQLFCGGGGIAHVIVDIAGYYR